MISAATIIFCLSLALITQVFADDWENFAQRSGMWTSSTFKPDKMFFNMSWLCFIIIISSFTVAIDKDMDSTPGDIFDIESELDIKQPTSRPTTKYKPTKKPIQPTRMPTTTRQVSTFSPYYVWYIKHDYSFISC